MKTIFKIIILALIIIQNAALSSMAQIDTTHQPLPLYRNAVSETKAEAIVKNQHALGQETDSVGESLRRIEELYTAGKFEEMLALSQHIYENYHLSKTENLQRLKYTIAAFKDFEYHREADSVAKVYLQKDPFYVSDINAPKSFQDVLNNYYTKPKFSVWLSLGKTISEPFMDTIRTIIDTASRKPEYVIQGFLVQVGFEYRPLKIFSVSIAPQIVSYDFDRTIKRTSLALFYSNESITIFSLPILVEAGIYRKREIFVPSVYAGIQMRYVLKSEYMAYTIVPDMYSEPSGYKDNTDLKNKFNYSILGGIRLNYNHRRMTYFADLGMSMDMLPFNNPKKIYSNNDLLYQNFYVPDVFRMLDYVVKLGIKVNLQYKTIAKYNYGY